MAGGDKGKLEEAKGAITQGLIGLTTLAASYVIIKFIETAIGMNLLNISWPPQDKHMATGSFIQHRRRNNLG
jgi:hypothetical protein